MTQLSERLTVLEHVLGEVGSPLMDHLLPGRDAAEVAAALSSRDIDPHPDLIDWFGWHDGTDLPRSTDPPGMLLPVPENRLIGPLHLPGFDEALAGHDDAVAHEAEENPNPQSPRFYWPGWFPVLVFTDHWLGCVDTTGSVGPVGTLFIFDVWRDNKPPKPFFPSLVAFVDAVIDTYRGGRVSPTELVIDPQLLPPTARGLHF